MKRPETELRKHFPTVYLTLISILVALAVESLLGRIDELQSLFVFSPVGFLHWLQISLVLLVSALFWWVIARWATTLPWAFGAVSIGGAVNYAFRARRALALVSQAGLGGQILAPTGIAATAGFLGAMGGLIGMGEISVASQIALNLVVFVLVFVFGLSEYRFWRKALGRHLSAASDV